jgi:hypothetical protein
MIRFPSVKLGQRIWSPFLESVSISVQHKYVINADIKEKCSHIKVIRVETGAVARKGLKFLK